MKNTETLAAQLLRYKQAFCYSDRPLAFS